MICFISAWLRIIIASIFLILAYFFPIGAMLLGGYILHAIAPDVFWVIFAVVCVWWGLNKIVN